MADEKSSSAVLPAQTRPRQARLWNVILLDDDEHTYDYVIEMLTKLFTMSRQRAYQKAIEVDTQGRTIAETTHLERAELKREQIHAYGPDARLDRSHGSMRCELEPAE